MSAEIWVAIITGMFTLTGVIITVYFGNKKQTKKNIELKNLTVEGEKCLLRSEMLHTYYKHLESKKIRQYEFENFIKLYEAYKSLGGNSFIDVVYEEVKEWKIIS